SPPASTAGRGSLHLSCPYPSPSSAQTARTIPNGFFKKTPEKPRPIREPLKNVASGPRCPEPRSPLLKGQAETHQLDRRGVSEHVRVQIGSRSSFSEVS